MAQARHERSAPEIAGAVVFAIVAVVVGRMVVGMIIADSVQKVTYHGIVGGALGALAMAVAMRNGAGEELPTTGVWKDFVAADTEGDLAEYRLQGFGLHITYGALLGAFLPRFSWGIAGNDVVHRLATGGGGSVEVQMLFFETWSNDWMGTLPHSILPGILFGILVFVPGLVMGLAGVFDMETNPGAVGRFFALHLLYGLVAGIWMGLYNPIVVPAWGAIF